MEQTIFSKKRQNREGKTFYSFLTTMKKKDGTEEVMQVRFREECGSPDPKSCPCNIEFDRKNANVSVKTYTRDDTGEINEVHTLWISAWKKGTEYIDTSLDEYV